MPSKIKIFFSFLVLIALFSVYSIFHSLGNKSSSVAIIGVQTPLPSPEVDSDHDGLTNAEEMIWGTDPFNPDTDGDGFKDGEEVASGHNPLVPGPDDLLPTTNITEKTSNLMAAGFSAGVLSQNRDTTNYSNALSDITDSIISDSAKALDPNKISAGPLISSSDSKASQQNYVDAIGSIILNDMWGQLINEPRVTTFKFANFNLDDPKNVSYTQEYFNTKAAYYLGVMAKLNVLAVPPSWRSIHQQLLTGLQTLIINHQALGQISTDPMKGIAAMNNLMTLYQEVQPTLVTIVQKIKENNLHPPNGQLWTIITSLTNGL